MESSQESDDSNTPRTIRVRDFNPPPFDQPRPVDNFYS
jgi:hypothetical protein